MINKLDYFGTALDNAGHYFWLLDGERMSKSSVYFKDIPFNPEELLNSHTPKGTVKYFKFKNPDDESIEYKVCIISGSCHDQRVGTKSVFWTTENIKLGDFKEIILEIPIAKKIIEKMSFEVVW